VVLLYVVLALPLVLNPGFLIFGAELVIMWRGGDGEKRGRVGERGARGGRVGGWTVGAAATFRLLAIMP